MPRDGSVPEVLPWQSLRKCAFAAPYFHDPELLLPDVNESGLPMTPEAHDTGASPAPALLDAHQWDPDQRFDIEDIVGATRVGRGWQLQVKWKGYPDATKEPLWRVTSQTKHPDILRAIKRCQDEYEASYPDVRPTNGPARDRDEAIVAALVAARRRKAIAVDQADYGDEGCKESQWWCGQ